MSAPTHADISMAGLMSTVDYIASLKSCESLLIDGPWDLKRRGIQPARVYKRLAGERDALLACLRDKRPVPAVHLLVLGDDPTARQACVDSWRLQSHPHAPCESFSLQDGPQLSDWLMAVPPHDLVLLAGQGDEFHPALATALALRDTAQSSADPYPAAWSWNTVHRTSGHLRFVRKPGCSVISLLGGDYVGRAIAVRAALLKTAPEEALTAFLSGSNQALTLWLASEHRSNWCHHPETLSATASADEPLVKPWALETAPLAALQSLAASLTESPWQLRESTTDSPQASALEPRLDMSVLVPPTPAQPLSVSVVVPFRDYVPETLKAVKGLSVQRGCAAIEVLLINNGSSAQSLADLNLGLQEFTDSLQIRIIDYPWGFSHSRQCNLGVREASFDTVVILNNDAYLQSLDAIAELIRWAALPGVGTVGVQIVDELGGVVCGGLRPRLRTGYDFESGFDESRDPILSSALREVAGNTGACFAMKKDRYLSLGGFDEQAFPIGLNDVDFCLRGRRAGLTHINLGWLRVCHKPGTSRGATDELMQKIILRERFPEIATLGQFQLGIDDHMSEGASQHGKRIVQSAASAIGGRPLWQRLISKLKSVLANG
ncbi:MAG: glycosyltransferase family 2 protein [Burkholderiaceae bacterium]